MANQVRIPGRIDFDASSVAKETNKATQAASAFVSKMRGLGKGLAGAFTLGAGIGIAKSFLNDADRIADLSANIGLTTDELQAFEASALQSGASSEKLASSLERLSQAQGNIASGQGEKALESLAALGVSAEDAAGPIGELFAKIAEGFAKTENIGALDELFGRGAVQLSGLLREIGASGGLDKLIQAQRLGGFILSPGELTGQAMLDDRIKAIANRAKKEIGGIFTPGAEDTTAIINQQKAIESQSAARRAQAQAIQQAAEKAKIDELHQVIGGATSPQGRGSELVRIGGLGGIRGAESEQVRKAREQLEELKKITKNTEPIKDIPTDGATL